MAWEWEVLAGPDGVTTEGPAWDGRGLFYTSIGNNAIRRYDPMTGTVSTVYRDTAGANGLAFDPHGRLYACSQDRRAILRFDVDGTCAVLADRFAGRRLNSPNDLALDAGGGIWFTDPRYGDDHRDRELDHCSVYRLAPPAGGAGAWPIQRVTFDTTRPNGILLAFDERTLYVAQSDYDRGAARQLRAYAIADDGSLGSARVLHDFGAARGIDGMCWDTAGNIVATCGWEVSGPGSRVAIFAPDGRVLEEHPVPAGRPTNCAFGGADRTDLYVTTISGHLYRVRNTGRRGHLPPPHIPPYIGGSGQVG
ncbi:MAG TPA: SMP-30/gluconolactonase/LRE family protein [Thermomicrobiales bacterium]|jgi:gluconolactonase